MTNNFFDGKETTLDNGLKLVTIKRNTQLMSLNIGINVGSIYENAKTRGISHFIEHMIFKGTKTKSNEEINDCLENTGGDYNAYTDYKGTVYNITTLCDELEVSINILSDMIINSTFPQNELDKERSVILSEIKSSKDDIEDLSFKKVNEIAFDKNPIKYEVSGYEKTVKNITREQIIEFYNKYYVSNNCYISIVSPYEHDFVIKIVKKYFNFWKNNEINKKYGIIENNKPIIRKSIKKDIEQSTIIYLYTFNNLSKFEELTLRILNHKLGDSSNSILFRELREKRGLVYDVYSILDSSENIKTLYIYTSVDRENVNNAMEIINLCIKKIQNREIVFNDNIMQHMKKVFKTSLASTLEDLNELGSYVLLQSMENEDIYEFINEMNKISQMKCDDLYIIAEKVFNNPTIHILESEESEDDE